MVHSFCSSCPEQLLRRELHDRKDGFHGDRAGSGLARSDGFSMTVVILNRGQLMTMGRLYPQGRPL